MPREAVSRYPTLLEVQEILKSLRGDSAQGKFFDNGRWAAHVVAVEGGSRTLVHYDALDRGSSWLKGPLWFEKGDTELIVAIVERTARLCGTLVLTTDVDDKPLVVKAGDTVAEALALWRTPPEGGWAAAWRRHEEQRLAALQRLAEGAGDAVEQGDEADER
jgi:hypothetical protein